MTNFADVLTVLAAGGGLALMLVMAAVPLMLDGDLQRERDQAAHLRGGDS